MATIAVAAAAEKEARTAGKKWILKCKNKAGDFVGILQGIYISICLIEWSQMAAEKQLIVPKSAPLLGRDGTRTK